MITLNFDEVLERTYNAKKGVDVRYGLGQGFEYCKQFADEAQGYATNAKASEKKATDAVAGIEQTKTDAVQAVQNAQTTATNAVQQAQSAATTAVTTKQTEAVQAVGTAQTGAVKAVDDERDAALQQVADSTQAAQTAASNAAASEQVAKASKEAAATSAGAAESSATAASGSASAAATSESNANQSAENSEASAARSEAAAKKAEAVVGTDKTFTIEGAPADAKAVGDIILDLTKETPQPIFYSKAEVEAKIKEILAKQQSEDYAKIKFWVSPDPTSPAELFGGTWEQIKDRFILAAGDTYAAGSTGGSPTHTHDVSGNAAIGVQNVITAYDSSGANMSEQFPYGLYAHTHENDSIFDSNNGAYSTIKCVKTKGSANEQSNIPPYVAIYVWQRIA